MYGWLGETFTMVMLLGVMRVCPKNTNLACWRAILINGDVDLYLA